MGGSVNAIESDYMQQEISTSAYQYQKEVEEGSRVSVGVNKFTQTEEGITEVFNIDDSIRRLQTEKILKLKTERDNIAVKQALNLLSESATGNANLMPLIIDAVEKYATLGEIADVLRNTFGEY
jgi:methylmalonyl-CoA mutase N-terminal domain/subunit